MLTGPPPPPTPDLGSLGRYPGFLQHPWEPRCGKGLAPVAPLALWILAGAPTLSIPAQISDFGLHNCTCSHPFRPLHRLSPLPEAFFIPTFTGLALVTLQVPAQTSSPPEPHPPRPGLDLPPACSTDGRSFSFVFLHSAGAGCRAARGMWLRWLRCPRGAGTPVVT